MRLFLPFSVLLLVLIAVSCQSSSKTTESSDAAPKPQETYLQFSGNGSVGSHAIVWELSLRNQQLAGRYRYDSQSEWLQLKGRLEEEEEILELEEADPKANVTGNFRMYGRPSGLWRGFWKAAGKDDSLSVTLTMDSLILVGNYVGWPQPGMLLLSKVARIVSPDSLCSITYAYWRATGADEFSKKLSTMLAPPSLQVRSEMLSSCLEAAQEMGQSGFIGSTFEHEVSLGAIVGDVLVVNDDFYSYAAGAAHGNYGSSTRHVLLPDFRELSPEDLFAPGYQEGLGKLVGEKLQTLFPEEYPLLAYQGVGDEMNFELTASGMTIYFNPYEIAPYSMGQIRVPISFGEVQEWLLERGPLGNMGRSIKP